MNRIVPGRPGMKGDKESQVNQESLVKMEPLDHKDQKGNVAHMYSQENLGNLVSLESQESLENLVNQESLEIRAKRERQLD